MKQNPGFTQMADLMYNPNLINLQEDLLGLNDEKRHIKYFAGHKE